jgi:hypothetical protein
VIPKGCVGAAPPRVKGLDTTLEVEAALACSSKRASSPTSLSNHDGCIEAVVRGAMPCNRMASSFSLCESETISF